MKQGIRENRVLSQWKLQGSWNGSDWKTLSEVNDCDDECKTESIHSLPSKEGIFNAFKVIKTNKKSDGLPQFDQLKFELFGSVCENKNCNLPNWKYNTRCSQRIDKSLSSL